MRRAFGQLPDGKITSLYTISAGKLTAEISDYGATLVRLWVPDREGKPADVVLGFEDPNAYTQSTTFMGATVGRNANRVRNAAFVLGGKTYRLGNNENENNLHSGPDYYKDRVWTVVKHSASSLCLCLESPNGDQGFPGNATIYVTYTLTVKTLRIDYDAVGDQDTVFNLTNHSYFNLAGHDHPERAMEQELILPARFFNPDDAKNIPTGEKRSVDATPMDFRTPMAVGARIDADYDALRLQHGYDHNYEVFTDPCAILTDPVSGRSMAVSTDCPGVQLYTGNFLGGELGKDGVTYPRRSGVCLETQYCPDSVNHPEWPQPITRAGEHYRSTTRFAFHW